MSAGVTGAAGEDAVIGLEADIDVDVLVVGYGPVGAMAALLLGRQGHRVLAVDRFDEPYAMPRAVHYDDEVARIFQGAGLSDALEDLVEPLGSYQWRTATGETLLRFDWPAGLGPSGWPASSMFSQPALEFVIDEAVARMGSVTVQRGVEVVSVDESGTAVLDDGRTVRARWVVAADGADSPIRRSLGVQVNDLGFSYDWLVVDVVEDQPRVWDPPAWQLCDPVRPTTLVPGGPGRRRFEFMQLPGESADELTGKVWELLAKWGLHEGNCRLERHAVYTFRSMWATQWRAGRILLAGDAAHLMPPFAGQGLCAGIRDAANLAWKLDLILTGRAVESIVDTYASERIGQVQVMTTLSVELGKLVCITDPEGAAKRDRDILSNQNDSGPVAPPPLPIGAGLRASEDANSGLLLPQGRVRVGESTRLLGDLLDVGFWLLCAGVTPSFSDESAATLRRIGVTVTAIEVRPNDTAADFVDVDGVYRSWFDSSNTSFVLVRPDGYVFGAASGVDDLYALIGSLADQLSLSSVVA